MDKIVSIKKEIIKIGKKMYSKGYAEGNSGNISCKVDEEYILITPTGSNLGELTENDLVLVNLNTNEFSGNKKPSSEKFMHINTYKKRLDAKCLIHAHTPRATVLAASVLSFDKNILAEPIVLLGNIFKTQYAMPSSDKLADLVSDSFIDNDVLLMSNHGVAICGNDLTETYYKLETLEFYADILIWTSLVGKTKELAQNDVDDLINLRKKLIKK